MGGNAGAEARRVPRGHLLFLSALAALAAGILLLGPGGGSGGRPDGVSAQAAVTVPAIPDSLSDALPATWLQPRNSCQGDGTWGPDVVEPLDTLWRIHTGLEFFAAPAVCGGVLYSGGNDGLFRAVDAADGTVRWSHATACGISSEAAVTDSAVFFGGQDGYVYALSRTGGRVLWTAGLGYHVFASCAVMADTVLVTGNSDGKVAALDTRTGGVLWHGSPGGVVLGPAVADTIAVFSTEDGVVSAWTVSGRELWHRDFPAQASAPAISGPGVVAGFADGTVRCLSLSDGSALWETDLTPSPGRVVVSRPACAGGRLVVGTCDSRVVCLSAADGSVEWETALENWVQVPPAVGDSLVYVSCDDRRLHLLDLATGAIVSSREIGGYSGTAPLLINGVLYLGTASGDLLALRGSLPPAGD